MFEYILQKEDCKIKIRLDLQTSYKKVVYQISDISILPKCKRKWISQGALIRETYEYRHADYNDRPNHVKQKYLEIVSEDDINKALQEFYKWLHPEKQETFYRFY